jgi:hypothetical protein
LADSKRLIFVLPCDFLISSNLFSMVILDKGKMTSYLISINGGWVIVFSWIFNYLCNQCLSPLMLWVRISIRARCTTLCDKVCQWLATGLWFSPGHWLHR